MTKNNEIKIYGNNNTVNISPETISKNSDSITKLIHFLSENLPREDNNAKINRVSKAEKKMEVNKLKDSLRKEIRENYGNISSVCNKAFSNSMKIWNDVYGKIYKYVISRNKDELIEDYEAECPIKSLLIYAFVKCKFLVNPEENNDTE